MASEPQQQEQKRMTFEQGLPVLQEAINHVIGILEGTSDHEFTPEECMRLYTLVYDICTLNKIGPPEARKFYELYKKTFEDYVGSKVLPSLRQKKDKALLLELLKRWDNHKYMTRWLLMFFHYVDRYFVPKRKLPTLQETSYMTFYKSVYREMNDQIRDAVISMIDCEREGEQIDQALVKNVLNIYVEMAEGSKKYYKKDFEEAMLQETATYYSRRASNWITSESYKNYMLKVEECLKLEKDRSSCYLHERNHKLIEVVRHQLLTVHASKLEEKK